MREETKVYTLFLFNDFLDDPWFFQLEGDFSRFNNVIANATNPADMNLTVEEFDALCDELEELVYDKEKGTPKVKMMSRPTKDWTHFVYCGFAP